MNLDRPRPLGTAVAATLTLLAFVAAALPWGQPVQAHAVPIIDVYLLAGQSNANGWAREIELTPARIAAELRAPEADDRILFAYQLSSGANAPYTARGWGGLQTQARSGDRWFGAEYSIGPRAAAAIGSDQAASANVERVAVLKAAAGGTGLVYWQPGNVVYNQHVNFMASQLDALAEAYPSHRIRVRALLWVQGENDALTSSHTAVYGTRLQTLVNNFETDLGLDHDLAVVYAALNTSGGAAANRAAINAQVATIAAERDDWAITGPTAGLTLRDNVHYDASGQLRLGEMLIEPAMAMAPPSSPAGLGDADCSGAVSLGDALLLMHYLQGTATLSDDCPAPAGQANRAAVDLTGDSTIDSADMSALLDCLIATTASSEVSEPSESSEHCHLQ